MTPPDMIDTATLRFERLLDAPVEKVWQYLVDPELRARWFMGGPTEPRVGGSIGMTMNHDRLSDGDVPTPEKYRVYQGHSWEERITRIDPPHLLAFTWEGGEAGEVTIELRGEEDRTRVVLTHTGLRGRDDAISFGGGWHAHLAALQQRIKDEGVPDFWKLHGEAEAAVRRRLDEAA